MKNLNNKFKITFAVTEIGANASAGDYFTAIELGKALKDMFHWEIDWVPKSDWYDIQDTNAIVAMTDHFDLSKIELPSKNIIKICWMRNWFDRWAQKKHFNMWDIHLCSSLLSTKHISSTYGITPHLLRIATNQNRFKPRQDEIIYDYIFTGSFWDAPRDIEALVPEEIGLKFALFGKNWGEHTQFRQYYKGFTPYHLLPKIYNQTKILVDDANSVTKEWGSVNSRVFDALASGTLVITNSSAGSEEVFDNKLPVYNSPEKLKEILNFYTTNSLEYNGLISDLRTHVLQHHTYEIRAHEFEKIITQHLQNNFKNTLNIQNNKYKNNIDLNKNEKLVSIIIPVFNQINFTIKCLKSIIKNTLDIYEIIIVDNGSTDKTFEILSEFGDKIRLIRNSSNLGFAKACNIGAFSANTPFLLFLNNDTEVLPGWLQPLLDIGSKEKIGAVGSKLLYPDGTIQHAGVVIIEQTNKISILPRHVFMNEQPEDLPFQGPTYFQAVTAACMLVKKEDFLKIDGFDENYWNGCEDVDFCFKLQMIGKKNVCHPGSIVIHYEGKSGEQRRVAIPKNNERLRSKWTGKILPDIIDEESNIISGKSKTISLINNEHTKNTTFYDQAIEWWAKFSGNKILNLIEECMILKKYDIAIKLLNNAFSIYKKDRHPELYILMSMSYRFLNKQDKSISIINQGLQRFPGSQKLIVELEEINKNRNKCDLDSNSKNTIHQHSTQNDIEIVDIANIENFSFSNPDGIAIIMPCIDIQQGLKTAYILNKRASIPAKIIIAHDTMKYGFIKTTNEIFKKINVKYVVFLAQDAFPGKQWLLHAFQTLEKTGKGLLAFNDGKWMGNLASFGMVRRSWIKSVYKNSLFFDKYISHAADNELTTIARATNEYIYNPNSVLIEVDYEKENKIYGNTTDRDKFISRCKNGFDRTIDIKIISAIVRDFQIFI
jgi:GT2 family glycosyltransferase